jgi:galactokinase
MEGARPKMPNTQPTLLDRAIQRAEGLGLGDPLLVRSPGRVNLMGEHTDYNGGLVLQGALDRSVILALAPRSDGAVRLHSMDLDASCSAPLAGPAPPEAEWAGLPMGVVAQVRRARPLAGFDLLYGSDLPRGAGLSCGSAIACGVAFGLNHLFDLDLTFEETLGAAVAAEHEAMGGRCGAADQFVNLRAKERCLLMLDCRDMGFRHVPMGDDGPCLVICDSQVRRRLSGSEYNARRAQCEAGAAALARELPGVASLRDVSLDQLRRHGGSMDPAVFDRCLFVLQENDRAAAMALALEANDSGAAGRLLCESHAGLRDLFRVSCPELDALVEGAGRIAGVHGARLTGAGFGGCTVNLVDRGRLCHFMEEMAKVFRDSLGKPPKMHPVALGKRTHVVEIA